MDDILFGDESDHPFYHTEQFQRVFTNLASWWLSHSSDVFRLDPLQRFRTDRVVANRLVNSPLLTGIIWC